MNKKKFIVISLLIVLMFATLNIFKITLRDNDSLALKDITGDTKYIEDISFDFNLDCGYYDIPFSINQGILEREYTSAYVEIEYLDYITNRSELTLSSDGNLVETEQIFQSKKEYEEFEENQRMGFSVDDESVEKISCYTVTGDLAQLYIYIYNREFGEEGKRANIVTNITKEIPLNAIYHDVTEVIYKDNGSSSPGISSTGGSSYDYAEIAVDLYSQDTIASIDGDDYYFPLVSGFEGETGIYKMIEYNKYFDSGIASDERFAEFDTEQIGEYEQINTISIDNRSFLNLVDFNNKLVLVYAENINNKDVMFFDVYSTDGTLFKSTSIEAPTINKAVYEKTEENIVFNFGDGEYFIALDKEFNIKLNIEVDTDQYGDNYFYLENYKFINNKLLTFESVNKEIEENSNIYFNCYYITAYDTNGDILYKGEIETDVKDDSIYQYKYNTGDRIRYLSSVDIKEAV